MARVRLLFAICFAVAALAVPQSALAVGPVTTPKTILTEGFESPVPVTYEATSYVPGGSAIPGYWGRVTAPKVVNPAHGGLSSLWCDGTNTTALARLPYKYADGSQGYAIFPLPQTVDYYQPIASLWYSFPKSGYSDETAFAPEWTNPAAKGVSNALNEVPYTAVNEWKRISSSLASETGVPGSSLSRTAGRFQLRWKDNTEPPNPPDITYTTNGQGPSVDDVTIAGWVFGPVRSLSATTTSISSTLTWSRPWRSTAGTSTEERPLSYRVWRAPKGTTDWTELTPAVRTANNSATVSYSDMTVAEDTAYTYAVQAWEPGTGDETTAGYGKHESVEATTKPFPPPLVRISTPASGTVVVGTSSMGISGTVQALDGATVSSVVLKIKRDDGAYFDNLTGLWPLPSTVTTFAAVVVGNNWSSAWIPTAADYKAHKYTITATARDSRNKESNPTTVTVKADTVPFVAPVAAITSPTAGAVVATTGTFALTGSATVQSGLPTPTVQVSLAHGSSWWNGSAWTTTQTWVPATVNGSAWTLSGVAPPANEYKTPSYVATVRATDAHALTGSSPTTTFSVDSVPFVAPTVGVTLPENNVDMIGTGPYTLRGTVTAVHPNLPLTPDSVRVFIKRDTAGVPTWWNGSAWVGSETSVTAIGTSNWTYSWQPPSSEYYVSTFTVYATALDDHGLLGTSANSVFKVNSTVPNPPDVFVSTPAGGLTSQVGTLAVTGTTAGRDGAVVQRVSVHIGRSAVATGAPTTWWNGGGWSASESSATYLDATYSAGAPSWTYDWKMPADEYAAHTYVLRAYGYDDRAQIGTSTPVSTQLDTVPWTAPTVSLSVPADGADLVGTGVQTMSGTVTAVRANLPLVANSVRVTIARDTAGTVKWWNGSAWVSSETSVAAVGTAAWTYGWMPPAKEYHTSSYTVRASATDAHGVTGTSVTRTFTVDSVPQDPPTTSVNPPLPNPATAAPITITGVAALASTVVGSPIVLTEVRVTIEAKSSAGTKSWWNGTGWQPTVTSIKANGTKAWNTTFTSKPKDDRTYTYTIVSRATDTHGLSGSSLPVTMTADNVGPKILSVRSVGRYAVEIRFSEKPYAPAGAGRIDARYFSCKGLALRKIIGWSKDGTRVRVLTSRQRTLRGAYNVTCKRVVDSFGN